ncbi:MAG: ABC transporter substrate-binding protein, partial [Pikeienuella sp.]
MPTGELFMVFSLKPSGALRGIKAPIRSVFLAATAACALLAAAPVEAQTLRVVKHSSLRVLDPIITTAYMSRNHGYMIFDTLFATDENFQAQPQMAEGYEVSDDKLTYTITLRDGLNWHDGAPVTAE